MPRAFALLHTAIVSESKRELEVKIEGEDVSLAEIVHHELLNDDDVVFAGVRPPHPLLKTIYLRVRTANGSPRDALISSGEVAAKNVRVILEELKVSFEQR